VLLFFKTSGRNYQTIRRNNTEDLAPQYECKFVTKKSFSAALLTVLRPAPHVTQAVSFAVVSLLFVARHASDQTPGFAVSLVLRKTGAS